MRLSQWQSSGSIWDQLQQLQAEMNQLFQRWGGEGQQGISAGGHPALNVWEDSDALYVEAEVPGLDIKDLEIYVTGGNQLTLKGERKPRSSEKGVWHRQERGYGTFVRTLSLPYNVDSDKVEARLENGVLVLKLPKNAAAKPRKISVKDG